ncbi:MAG: ATP-binding protein [Oscillochloris sp.]|nr:ATP-binding protein [Oscillochloris sp.]
MAPRLRLSALLLLSAAVGLLLFQTRLLTWATRQLHPAVVPGAPESTPFPLLPAITPAQLLAHGLTALLRPPVIGWLQIGALLGLGLLGVELMLWGVIPLIRTRNELRAVRALLHVQALPATGNASADSDLLRSLHALIPVRPLAALIGRAPWLALTLHGRPGMPVELGIAVAAPDQQQLEQLNAAVRAAVVGHAPGAFVEVADDPLVQPTLPSITLAWRAFRLSGPLDLPLRTLADAEGDLLGPLMSALRPTDVLYTELQLALRPLRGWALNAGWRAAGLRRLLRLQQKADHALGPDARRLEARLAAPAFAAELRIITLARAPNATVRTGASIQRVVDALGAYAERTGPWRQGMIASGGRVVAKEHAGNRARRQLAARRPAGSALPRLLLPLPAVCPALILTVDEIAGLWHLPTAALAELIRTLACRHITAPMHAFVPHFYPALPHREGWVALGTARMPDGSTCWVGLTIADLRYVLHLTAGVGAGKSRLLANLCRQLLRSGYCLIDGKGDDQGGLSNFVLRLIPLGDERRVVLLDPRDARWPVGMNPLAGMDLSQPGAIDQVVANVFALFARIDPETWGGAQGMRDFLDKALRLVLASEPHPTLANVKQALLDGDYRTKLLERCRNRDVTDYWQTVFPRLGESQRASRDALLRRFDKLLSADLLRLMITQPEPALSFAQAIAARDILIIPIPNVALGDLAGVYAMLMFQQFLRAAFARPGDDQTRVDYALMIDELQVLIAEAANDDIETALSRLRSFVFPLVIAHQSLSQLGPVEPLVQINAENRIILKTREPDAGAYARQYGHAGITAGDIINQDPSVHQYAILRCAGKPAGPFSMAPLPWPEPLEEILPPYSGPPWQEAIAANTLDPKLDRLIAQFAYEDVPSDELNRRAEQLALMPDELFAALLDCWEELRRTHLAYINAHPDCIPDKQERIRWRSRLRYALPYVLAEAIYRRSRPEVAPEAPAEGRRRGPGAAPGVKNAPPDVPLDPPAFTQADREPPASPPRGGPLFPEDDDEG